MILDLLLIWKFSYNYYYNRTTSLMSKTIYTIYKILHHDRLPNISSSNLDWLNITSGSMGTQVFLSILGEKSQADTMRAFDELTL